MNKNNTLIPNKSGALNALILERHLHTGLFGMVFKLLDGLCDNQKHESINGVSGIQSIVKIY